MSTRAKAPRRKLPRGISVNPGGRYRVKVNAEGREYSLGTYETLTDAKAAHAIAMGEIARGTFVPPSKRRTQLKAQRAAAEAQAKADGRTCRELAEAFLSWKEAQGRTWGTVYAYRRHLESHFLDKFGERPVSSLTADDLCAWLDDLESSAYGPSVASEVHGTVTGVFRFATGEARGLPRAFVPWCERSPVPPLNTTRRRTAPKRDVILSPAELDQLGRHMSAPGDHALILLAGWCALRIGESLALRRRHVTTDRQGRMFLTVESQVQARGRGTYESAPKSEAGNRTIPVPAAAREVLAEHLANAVQPGPDSLLFPRRGGNMLSNPNTVRRRFNVARDKLSAERVAVGGEPLDGFTFHGLRHTGLTRLGQNGATEAELMAFAGHADPSAVRIYQHAERDRLAALADRMTGSA